jgi:hypothetical protein
MNRRFLIINAMLWATAIVASAVLHAPSFLSLILLPGLASAGLLSTFSADRQP